MLEAHGVSKHNIASNQVWKQATIQDKDVVLLIPFYCLVATTTKKRAIQVSFKCS